LTQSSPNLFRQMREGSLSIT